MHVEYAVYVQLMLLKCKTIIKYSLIVHQRVTTGMEGLAERRTSEMGQNRQKEDKCRQKVKKKSILKVSNDFLKLLQKYLYSNMKIK